MEIKPKVRIPICIEQGSVYLYKLEAVNKDGSPYKGDRFFIVLNVNPKTDDILVLVTITKKIDNSINFAKRTGEDGSTIVPISPADFSQLNVESVVNCNRVYDITMEELITKVEDGGKVFSQKLPRTVISALVSGVLKSNQVQQEFKEMLI